jgi:hypothetical protein
MERAAIPNTPASPAPLHWFVMRAWIIEKYDWFIYHRAYHSMRRMCERNAGFAYLFELWIRDWRSRNPISPELERSTEFF